MYTLTMLNSVEEHTVIAISNSIATLKQKAADENATYNASYAILWTSEDSCSVLGDAANYTYFIQKTDVI